MVNKLISTILALVLLASPAWCLPAFPGAEGFGTSTIGGRNASATVYKVTNLNNSGTGSFRAACEASGARYVVFMVSGDIHLTSMLQITNPYITIMGQTSPGGISISGMMTSILTHDVVMTHMRFRRGTDLCSAPGYYCENGYGDSLRIMGNEDSAVYNVVVDHCSVAWGADETLDISTWYGDTYDITVSHSLIAGGCDNTDASVPNMDDHHGLTFLISGHYQDATPRNISISVHHNFMTTGRYRFPILGAADCDLYNNVMYNFDEFSTHINRNTSQYADPHLNTRHNYYRQGPLTDYWNSCAAGAGRKQIGNINDELNPGTEQLAGTPYPMFHSAGNMLYEVGGSACSALGDTTGKFSHGNASVEFPWLPSGWISATPLAVATAGDATVTTMTPTYAGQVVAAAGANRIANAGTPSTTSDNLDTSYVTHYNNGTGDLINKTSYPTGWPVYSQVNDNPTDSDGDGMIDATEVTLWGSTGAHAANDVLASGYSAIETYAHYLGGYSAGGSTPTISNVTISNGRVQ